MNTDNLICYKSMPEWTNDTLPRAFQNKHNTKVGTWAKLSVFSGKLKYYAMDEDGEVTDTFVFDSESDVPFVEPQAWHKVESLSDDLRCQLSFYCLPDDYYQKKYSLSATHSEVIETLQRMKSAGVNLDGVSALDMGCGGGRNVLYLQRHGFDVTALDRNATAIGKLQTIIEQENLEHITAKIADLHQVDELALTEQYDLAISTVVLMFLDADKVPTVIDTMQQHTKVGGYNLIVCAIDSEDYPYANYQGLLPFQFGLQAGELSDYYQGWNIVKYNEDVGHLHRLDNEGNPIALRFATLIAQKQ